MTKTEQTEVCQIALSFLTKPHSSVRVLADLDLSDEYLASLRVKLSKLLNPKPASAGVKCNDDQQVYVIPAGDGCYSCHGYDNLLWEANDLGKVLGMEPLDPSLRGTLTAYEIHAIRMKAYVASPHSKNTWFSERTPKAVVQILEQYRKNRKSLRLFYGDLVTGTSWLDEHDMIGRIGRSMGPMRVPLLITSPSDDGGGAILTASIIRLMDVSSGEVLWQHEKFNVPPLLIKEVTDPGLLKEGLQFEVSNGARFYTARQADDYVKFLRGERMRLPTAKKQ